MNAIHWPSKEKTGLRTVIGASPVTGRCVLSLSDAAHNCPPRVNAISFLSRDNVKLPASPSPPPYRDGFAPAIGATVHRPPSREKRISFADSQVNELMSDVRMSGSSGKSV